MARKDEKNFYSFENTTRALKKENRILRAEIKRLNQIIKSNADLLESKHQKSSDAMLIWHKQEKEAGLLSSPTYLKYLISKITGGSLFAFSKRAMGYFRKFKLVSTFMRIASSVLAIIGTGAFFIFISGAVVFIVPFVVAFTASIYFIGTVWRASAFRSIEHAIAKKAVYVFFPSRKRSFRKDSLLRNTLDIISNDTENQSFAIIISPYVFSAAGFFEDKVKFYPIVRFEKTNLCILRKHSFFLLRRKILGLSEDRIHYIY